jgi:hypothetical protein
MDENGGRREGWVRATENAEKIGSGRLRQHHPALTVTT